MGRGGGCCGGCGMCAEMAEETLSASVGKRCLILWRGTQRHSPVGGLTERQHICESISVQMSPKARLRQQCLFACMISDSDSYLTSK